MAGMSNADPFDSLTVDSQSLLITKDMQGSDSSAPFSPQWLLPKLGDNKLGLEAGEKHADPLKVPGNIEDLSVSKKKKDVFRPSLYDGEKVRHDCWTDEEREADSAIRRDIQEGEEIGDSRKLERWSNSSSKYSSESRHFPSERWTGSGSREGPYEPRRESKWSTRWGPDDKVSENWREKCPGKDGEPSHNKGAHYQNVHSKDIKNQGKNTDKDGEHYTRSWRTSPSVNRARGEASPYLPSTTNKPASSFSYGRGKGDTSAYVFPVDRSRDGTSNVSDGGSICQFPSGITADKSNGCQRDPPGLRYSRVKLFDIYRMTDLNGYWKAFEGLQDCPLIQTNHLVPLALTAPIAEELVIMEAIENGEFLSSSMPQASKDGSIGNNSVDSGLLPPTKSGIGADERPVMSGYGDERTDHVKIDHSFYVEGAVFDNSSRENLGQYQGATLTAEAFKLDFTPNSTHHLGKIEPSKLEKTVPWISQSVGGRSFSSSNDLRNFTKGETGSSDMGLLNRRELLGIELSRCADSLSYIGSNLQRQDSVNIRSDIRIESQIRRQPSITIEHGQGDLYVLEDMLSDQKPQQYMPPEHLSLFYRDPQGQIQGPFFGSNLIEWFDAGYFGMELPVRLASAPADVPFSMLGDVIPQLRTRARPPPGFGASRPKDIAELPDSGKGSGTFGIHLGISDLELTKNGQIFVNESKVEEENRFLESLMAGRINSSLPQSYLSEGIQGHSGLAGGRTSFQIENMSEMKYMPQKMSLEQQRLLTPYRTGSDSPAFISKTDSFREVPIPLKLLPQIGKIPHQQLNLLSILQPETNKTSPPHINSALPLWPNFPEVQAIKNTHGGIDITKDSMGLHPTQQISQNRLGTLPNRLQPQFQPSLLDQTSFFGLSSRIIPPEKLAAPEFSQDAHMVNLLQQYMLSQDVHSQAPHTTHLNEMELMLLLQQQKMEEQQPFISHTFSGNPVQQYLWPLNTEAVNVNTSMENLVQPMHEHTHSNPMNILGSNESHVLGFSNLNLNWGQDASISSGTVHSALDMPNLMTDLESHSNKMDSHALLEIGTGQAPTAEQTVSTTNKLVLSQGSPQTNEIVAIASSNLKDIVSSQEDEVGLDLVPSVSKMTDHMKDSLSAISKQAHNDIHASKVIDDAELSEVRKASEKKSRKHKHLQKAAPSQKSKPNIEIGVEKDVFVDTVKPLVESSEVALDKETKVDEAKAKSVKFVQLSSSNLTLNPAPGQKVKSLLEIQLAEQSKAHQTQPYASSMLTNVSITSEQKYTIDCIQCDSHSQVYSENPEETVNPKKHGDPWNSRSRTQLHDVLANGVFLKVPGVGNGEKITYLPPLVAENEGVVDHDFIEAKDSRKARKKATKNKGCTTKSSLPSSSADLSISVSLAEKPKTVVQPLQDKELLPSPPSAPSLGDFVFWKGDQASRVTPLVWSTDSVKVQKPAFLKDIIREQDTNVKSGQQQIPIQSPTNVQPSKGSGGCSLGKVSASPSKVQLASPIQMASLDSGHQKTGMEDDLFWGPPNQTKQWIRSDFPTIANSNSEKMIGGKPPVKVAYGEGPSKKASSSKLAEHSTMTSSPSPSIKQSISKGKKDSEARNSDATEFRNWCEEGWMRLTGTNDTSFLEFCLKQTTTEAETLLRENVSLLDHGKEFVDKFIDYKKFLSSEAIEVAFEGPRRSNASRNVDAEPDSIDGLSRGKKGKKGKKVSPALLGFNVVSNRIMMGEIQTVED